MPPELDKAMLQMVTMIETKVRLEKTKIVEMLKSRFYKIKEHLLGNGQTEIDRDWIAQELDDVVDKVNEGDK